MPHNPEIPADQKDAVMGLLALPKGYQTAIAATPEKRKGSPEAGAGSSAKRKKGSPSDKTKLDEVIQLMLVVRVPIKKALFCKWFYKANISYRSKKLASTSTSLLEYAKHMHNGIDKPDGIEMLELSDTQCMDLVRLYDKYQSRVNAEKKLEKRKYNKKQKPIAKAKKKVR